MQVLNIFHVLIAIAMIVLILVQRGPGATAGAAFGSGASGTVFGARGSGSFLTRTTWILATLFCGISLGMAVAVSRLSEPDTDLGVVAGSGANGAPTEQVADGADIPPAAEDVDTVAPTAGDEATGPAASDLPVLPQEGSDEDVE